MPRKSPELSQEQRKAIETAVQKAKLLQEPSQEILVPIDSIDDKATRLALILALKIALDEELEDAVIASLTNNTSGQYLRVSTPPQT